MTDVRQRLADALRDENLKFRNGHLDGIEWCLATADILLSLPGIAIIELPDSDGIAAQHITYGTGGDDCECCPPWIRDDDVNVDYSLIEGRVFAAALLAAANAAELVTPQGDND